MDAPQRNLLQSSHIWPLNPRDQQSIPSVSMSPVLISITKAQVPSYLVGSEFYNSLDGDDCEEFSVPAENLRLALSLYGVEDAAHLLRTLQFWGVSQIPIELMLFIMQKHEPHCYARMCQILSDCDFDLTLLDSYRVLQQMHHKSWFEFSELEAVKKTNAVPILVNVLFTGDELTSKLAKTLLDVVARSETDIRNHLLSTLNHSSGAINSDAPLCAVRNSAKLYAASFSTAQEHERWTRVWDKLLEDCLLVLSRLMNWTDDETVQQACQALYSIIKSSRSGMWAVFNANLAPRYVELLSSSSEATQALALMSVGEFALVVGYPVTRLIELGVLPVLKSLLGHAHLERNVCWIVNNVLGNSSDALQAVLDAGVLERILELQQNTKFKQKSSCWPLLDAVHMASSAQSVRLVEIGIVLGLCGLLSTESEDVLDSALTSLHILLKKLDLRSGARTTMRRAVEEIVERGALEDMHWISLSRTLPMKICTRAGDVVSHCCNVQKPVESQLVVH